MAVSAQPFAVLVTMILESYAELYMCTINMTYGREIYPGVLWEKKRVEKLWCQ